MGLLMGSKAVLCLVVVLVVGIAAVVEKTREDHDQRRYVFSRNRTDTRHSTDKKHPMSHSPVKHRVVSNVSHFHEATQFQNPTRKLNRSSSSHRPHRYGGSIQIGPGFNIQISNDMDFDFGEDERWWKGPNVCFRNETREEPVKGLTEIRSSDDLWKVMHHRLMVSHVCDDTGTAYKCTTTRGVNGKVTTSVKIYECCHGYERQEDEPGCVKAYEPTDLLSTLERLNATEMLEALRMSGVARIVNRENYTLFAPINDAFEKYRKEETNANVVKITPELVNLAKNMDDIIVGQLVKGFVETADVEDEQLIHTELQSADIRINKYNINRKKLMTANCVPMVTKDVQATNGVVHLVQDLLPTVTQSVDHLVSRNPQLMQLNRVMKSLQLNDQGQYTLFAPTNSAFEDLKPGLKDKILKGHRCGVEILRHHLLPNVICSAVTENRALTKNVLDRYVTLSRTAGKLMVNDAEIVQSDIMGTNGVVHIIDKVLIPEDAGDILDAADRTGTRQFLELVESAGLSHKLQNLNNFTMFLPNDKAIKALPSDTLKSLRNNVDQLEQLIDYHVVPGRIKYRGLANDMQLPTLGGKKNILVKSYYSFPFSRYSVKTVQCSPIVQTDVNSCGDMVHVVSKVLLPPVGDVLNVLASNPDFTRLMSLIQTHHLEDLFKPDSAFTLFAPTNKAFESLSAEAFDKLGQDRDKLESILKSHMISDYLCCAGVFENAFPFSSREVNLDGWIVAVENSGRVSYGHVPVASCDNTATNGVVHGIDKFVPAALSRYGIVQPATPWRRFFGRLSFDDIFDYLD